MENKNSNGLEGGFPFDIINEKSFELIYKKNWKFLYDYALQKTSSHEISQEIVQSVFVKLWEKRDSIKMNNSKSYLFMMVKNSIVDHYKQKLFLDIDSVKDIPDFEYSLFLDDLENKLHQEIDKLHPKAKEIFLLSRMEGIPINEISRLLETPKRTVEYYLAQAIAILKTVFKEFLGAIILFIQV